MSGDATEIVEQPALQELSPSTPGPQKDKPTARWRWLILVVGILTALAVIYLASRSHRKSSAPAGPVGAPRTTVVTQGNFSDTLRLTGATEAVTSYTIFAPRLAGENQWSLTIVYLAPNGSQVKRGERVVEFDRQDEINNYLDRRSSYMDLADQVAKQEKNDLAAKSSDQMALQTAKDQVKTAQLEMQRFEVLSRINQEITREKLIAAQASLAELQKTYHLKRAEAAANLRGLKLQRDQAQRAMLYSLHNEARMVIPSPINGVVVLNSVWKEGRMALVEEGDVVHPGMGFMMVVNPSAMDVSASVNQLDVGKLRVGELANVRLDAYPGLVLPSKLESIGPIATPGQFSSRVRTFRALFSVREGDPRLMPDLSAAVDVQLQQRDDALMVPRDSVWREHHQTYVYVKDGLSFKKQPVSLGPENNLMVVVESGLKAGEVVRRQG